MALLYTANMRFPLVEVETASDDTRQNIFYGPATGCNDSALLSDQKLQRRVPCMSPVLIASLLPGAGIKQTCLSITSSASGAGGSLAMSWLNWR